MTDRTLIDRDTALPAEAEATPSPRQVAERWVAVVQETDTVALRSLYEVGAALHNADEVVLGPERIATAVIAMPQPPDTEFRVSGGRHGMVTLTWDAADDDPEETTRFRVRRGRIVEQWIGERHSSGTRLATVPMNMSTSGDVTPEEHDLVWDMVDKVVNIRDQPVTYVDVRLTHQAGSARLDPVSLRVIIGLTGGSVRANARAGDVRSAAIVVESRLKQALHRRAERRSRSQGSRVAAPTLRDDVAPRSGVRRERPPTEREVVRHKTVSPGPSTFEEATFDLVTMDYDFFLYVDIASERDALVARADGEEFVEHTDPPVASVASARERLDAGNEPFVFFNDEVTGRGHVLYRRLDGHYGLIVPAED